MSQIQTNLSDPHEVNSQLSFRMAISHIESLCPPLNDLIKLFVELFGLYNRITLSEPAVKIYFPFFVNVKANTEPLSSLKVLVFLDGIWFVSLKFLF